LIGQQKTQKTSLHHNKEPRIRQNLNWRDMVRSSITTADELARHIPINKADIQKVVTHYPMKITPYFLSLIKNRFDPLWKQVVPDPKELEDHLSHEDPLYEEKQSPVRNLVHRYPDRVLFLVSTQCAIYCRYCMRKRIVGKPFVVTDDSINAGIEYIRNTNSIREVLVSGGDPLLLEYDAIQDILKKLRAISHVEILRIHTRVPCSIPQRINKHLTDMLKQFHPIFLNIQFNHPDEITPESAIACRQLADAGIPLGCQTVLLKGVNDSTEVMHRLMQNLLKIRVKPYYLHHPDPVKGTSHFRTSVFNGLKIMKALRGRISGMGIPQYMIDLPGGGGKIPLLPKSIKGVVNGILKVENFNGEIFDYPAY